MNMSNQLNCCEKHKCSKVLVRERSWECKKCLSELLEKVNQEFEENLLKNLLSKKINSIQIPLDLKNKGLDNFQVNDEYDEKIVLRGKEYVDQIIKSNNYLNLLITGPTGVGKSHLAVGILKYCYEQKYFRKFVCYSTSFGLANKVIATWNNHDLNEEDVLREYTEIELLVIDDLGYDDIGKKAEIINKIIYRRHENHKSTIITSNLKVEQIVEYMGSRTSSRFFSHLYADIQIDTEDFRMRRK